MGKTLQKMLSSDVYRPICVTYISMCLFVSMDPSYLSRVGPFQLAGSSVSMIFSVNGFLLEDKLKVIVDYRGFDISSYVVFLSFH